jgi:two-component system invasion response regulator UvrY
MPSYKEANLTRILVADNHRLFHPSIKVILSAADDLVLMGEVTESDELRQLCQQKPHPDLLLFSPNLDGSSVVEILDYVGKHCPSIKILVMLSHTEETNSKQLIDHGVRGIILKNEPPEKLLEAICAIVQGQLWFSALLMPILLKAGMVQNHE